MAIARAHAREAMTKHDSQRESFLAYCRNNWKRYAAGISRSKSECDRFAAVLDGVTRDLIALAEAAPNEAAAAEILRGDPPPAWEDSLEGATDSVIIHEAYQEPEILLETVAATADEVPEMVATDAPGAPLSSPSIELGPAPETAEQLNAEEEDRLAARYGFRAPAEEPAGPAVGPPEHAEELQRKVRAVLLAHRPKSSS